MSIDSGLIILGNSGVGKSFLANILLERDAFNHKFSPGAVTTAMEYEDITFDQHRFTIFNVPGLIEADQTQIDRNKEEIDKAFRKKPNSLILFVFGHQGGRIRNEDILAFQALNDAYQFNIESLVLVVNNLPKDRPPNYEGTVIVMLKNAIKLHFDKICFLDEIKKNSEIERAALRDKFLQTIVMLTPREHRKHKDVNLQATSIQELKDTIDGLQRQFFVYKNLYNDEILRQQQDYDTSVSGAAIQMINIGLKLCDLYVNSCFVEGTLVRMADGTEQPIETVRADDYVLGTDGQKHKVMFLDVEELGNRYLYGINETKPFFTWEHVFITADGEKVSVNPNASENEEPSLKQCVNLLETGVVLQTCEKLLNGHRQSSTTVNDITSMQLDEHTIVFNVVLESGNTYYANGFAVSDMFPDLSRYPRMFKFLHLLWRSCANVVDDSFDDILTPGGQDRLRLEKFVKHVQQSMITYLSNETLDN